MQSIHIPGYLKDFNIVQVVDESTLEKQKAVVKKYVRKYCSMQIEELIVNIILQYAAVCSDKLQILFNDNKNTQNYVDLRSGAVLSWIHSKLKLPVPFYKPMTHIVYGPSINNHVQNMKNKDKFDITFAEIFNQCNNPLLGCICDALHGKIHHKTEILLIGLPHDVDPAIISKTCTLIAFEEGYECSLFYDPFEQKNMFLSRIEYQIEEPPNKVVDVQLDYVERYNGILKNCQSARYKFKKVGTSIYRVFKLHFTKLNKQQVKVNFSIGDLSRCNILSMESHQYYIVLNVSSCQCAQGGCVWHVSKQCIKHTKNHSDGVK